MNLKTDEELIAQIQEGDVLAFEEIVQRYQGKMLRFIARIVRDAGDAQDVVQDAFVKLYKTIDRVDTRKKFSTYFFQIAKNTAFSLIRSRKKEVSLQAAQDVWDDTVLIDELEKKEKAQHLTKILDSLEPKYRRVITLYYFHQLSYEEVSKKLHIPVNTVRTHLKRAKEKLKTLVQYENN